MGRWKFYLVVTAFLALLFGLLWFGTTQLVQIGSCNSYPGANQGTLFLNRWFCNPGFTGLTCTEPTLKAPPPCSPKSDMCFFHEESGICAISFDRWKRAQACEQGTWHGSESTDDRKGDHLEGFQNYALVRKELGDVLEIGSGPWTQLGFLIDVRPDVNIRSITLWEPGINVYLKTVPTCAFKDGKLRGRMVNLVSAGAEKLTLFDMYDTIMMINVLEHTQNLFIILTNLYNALRPGMC
jgi:hypothetical protein